MPKTPSESLLAALSEYGEQHRRADAADKSGIALAFYRKNAALLSWILSSEEISNTTSSDIADKVSNAQKELLDSLLLLLKTKSDNLQTKNRELFNIWTKNLGAIMKNLHTSTTSRHGIFVTASAASAAATTASAATTSYPHNTIEAGTHRKKP